MRQGEVFGLTADRIDFLRKTVRVDRQLVYLSGRDPYLGDPKTNASIRTIPLPDFVVEALARHIKDFGTGTKGLIFVDDDGEPLRRNRFSVRVWRPAVKASGAPADTGFHDLRHYYASLLIRHGCSIKVVQARLGHATAAETLDTYSHLWPDSDDQTREAIATHFVKPVADCLRTAETS
jgi:integrase